MNVYPIAYISKQFSEVLVDYVSSTSLLRHIGDEYQFHQLRRRLMGQPTPRQSQIEAQIEQYKEINEHDLEEQPKQISAPKSIVEQVEKKTFQDKIIIHYTHENRFTSMKRDMHELFSEAFKNLGIDAVRLIVGHRNSPSMQRELIRKRPHMKLMTLQNSDSKDNGTTKTNPTNNHHSKT